MFLPLPTTLVTPDSRDDVTVLTNPLAQHALADLRRVETDSVAFRRALERLGTLSGYALAESQLPTRAVDVETPLGTATGRRVTDDIVFVGILRAAVPFVEGLLEAVPHARQGLVSASRDEAGGMDDDGRFAIDTGYVKLPDIDATDTVVVADPMLATGSTMVEVLGACLTDRTPERTVVCAAVSAPAGVERVTDRFDVEVVTASVDDGLDEHGFIVPGLGDAGDRAFGTEE